MENSCVLWNCVNVCVCSVYVCVVCEVYVNVCMCMCVWCVYECVYECVCGVKCGVCEVFVVCLCECVYEYEEERAGEPQSVLIPNRILLEMWIVVTLYFIFAVNLPSYDKKTLMTIYVGEDVEQVEHSSTVGGSANLYNHYGNQYGGF
ncbi:hypothetical protein STEG23_033967 [Scotinomys teguina]